MPEHLHTQLSRRERQIMDAVYKLGNATAADVRRELPEDVGYDSVRVTLGILEKKGHVTHRRDGPRYVYAPTVPHERASLSALDHVLKTFFRGSPTRAIFTLLDQRGDQLSESELAEIAQWVEETRKKADSRVAR